MASVVSILVSLHTATSAGLIDLQRGLRSLEHDAKAGDKALKNFKGAAVGLTPALIPIAAQLAPIAAGLGAATVAVAAFGAAVAPQIKTLAESAKAQTKAADATTKYGAASKQAVTAQDEYRAILEKMPPATREAAAAYSDLTAAFKDWSNATAKDTMPVLTKGMADFQALLPHMTPLVESVSTQLDRLVTVAGGGMESPGFDRLSKRFAAFTDGVLKRATDEVIHFSRVLSEGKADGPLNKLMEYAEQNGPRVEQTLKDLGTALAHIGEAAAAAGPGMLTIVDTLARIVSAIPPEALTRLIQMYTAFRLLKGTAAGVMILSGAVGNLSRAMQGMAVASVAAGGGAAGVRAALATLSTGTKIAGSIAVVAGIALALKQLSNVGKSAPADIDRMTGSIGQLGRTGKASGELTRVYGDDLGSLTDAFELMDKGISNSGIMQGLDKLSSGFGLFGKGDIQDAKDKINDFDEGLAGLVKGGNAELAAAAVKRMSEKWTAAGKPAEDFTKKLNDYESALADAKFESDLIADSMGLFGAQAQSVQKQLDAQKTSADGLRQSIQALNDVNRAGLSAMSDFEQAIDDAAKAVKGHEEALRMVDGQLDLSGQGARDANKFLTDLAAKTDAATAAARDQGKSWEEVKDIYDKGRASLIANADAMGLNTDKARELADQILDMPTRTTFLKGNIEDLQKKLASAKKQLASAPRSKTVAIRANIAQIENRIRDAQARINALHGKEIIIRATYSVVGGKGMNVFHEGGGYARGGQVRGPGSGTSDSLMIRASNGEFVVNAAATARNRELLEAINSGAPGFAKGGVVSDSERQARADAAGQLTISAYGQMAGYTTSSFTKSAGAPGDIASLVSTLNDWRAKIKAATHGAQESKLLKALANFGSGMLKNERALEKVNSQLDGAKGKLASLKDSFAQLRDGIASSVVSFGSIAKQGGAGPLGQISVAEQLRGSVGQAQKFAQALEALKKKGLNAQSLSEIAQAGIEGGGLETAERLLGASSGDIKQINELEKQLIAAGKAAGTSTADAMYGGGIKAAEALVKGLEKSQKRIEAVMAAAAQAMADQLKKAFGIGGRKGAGGVVGAAAGGGPRTGLTLVGEYGPELAHLAAGTMVRSAPDTQRMLSGGGGRIPPIEITLMIGDTVLGEVIVDPLSRVIRNRGGNVQAVLGVKGK